MAEQFKQVSQRFRLALVILLSFSVSVCHSYPTEEDRKDFQKYPGFLMTKDGYPSFAVGDSFHHEDQVPVGLPNGEPSFYNEDLLKSIPVSLDVSALSEKSFSNKSMQELLDLTISNVTSEPTRDTVGYSTIENTDLSKEKILTINQNDTTVLSQKVEVTESDNNEQHTIPSQLFTEEPLQNKYETTTELEEAISSSSSIFPAAHAISINTTSLAETNDDKDDIRMDGENSLSINTTDENSTFLLKTGKEEKVNEIFFDEERLLEEENEFQSVYPSLSASQGDDELSAKSLITPTSEIYGDEVKSNNGNETHLMMTNGMNDNVIVKEQKMTTIIGGSQDNFSNTTNEEDTDPSEEATNLHTLENENAHENTVVNLEDDIAKSEVTTEKSITNEPEVTEANGEIDTTNSPNDEATVENATYGSEENAYTPQDNDDIDDETTASFTTLKEEIVDYETTDSTAAEKAMQDIYNEDKDLLSTSYGTNNEKVEVIELETNSSTHHVSYLTVFFMFAIGLGLMMLCTRMPVYCYNILRYLKSGEGNGVPTFVRKWQKRGYSPVPMGDKYV